MTDDRRRAIEAGLHHIGEGNQLAAAVGHIKVVERLHHIAAGAIGLNIHLPVLLLFVGLVDETAAIERAEHLHRLAVIDVERSHPVAVDIQPPHRRIAHELGVEVVEVAAGLGGADQLARHLIEIGGAVAAVAEVVELEREAALGAEAGHRRRRLGHHQGTGNLMELLVQPGNDLLGRLPLAAALIDRLQAEEEDALVERPAVEAGTTHDLAGDDLRFLGQDRLGFGGHLHRGLD